MPEVTVCKACGGTGKIKHKSATRSSEEASVFLLCRSCGGSGWITSIDEDEAADKVPIDVKSELRSIELSYRSDELAPYLKLLIRLIDERLPLKRDE